MAFAATVVDTVVDSENASYLLDGVSQVTTVVVGGVTYVIAAGTGESGLTVFSLSASGELTYVSNKEDGWESALGGVSAVTSIQQNGRTYVIAGAPDDDGFTVFELGADGVLTFVSEQMSQGGTFHLDDVRGLIAIEINGTIYLTTASGSNSAIETFQLIDGIPSWPSPAAVDDDDMNIGGAKILDIVTVFDRRFLLAAGAESGFSILGLGGTPLSGGKIDDDATTKLTGITGFTSVTINNATYIYVASSTDAGVSVYAVDYNGQTTNAQNYDFGVAVGPPKAFEFEGVQYVAFPLASGMLAFYSVGTFGALTFVSQVQAAPAGSYPSAVSMTSVGGVLYAIVPSATGDGLSVVRLAEPLPPVDGTTGDDVMPGTAGDDIINGDAGDDLIKGGDGLDTLNGGDDDDDLRGEDGNDTLNGDAGDDLLIGGAGDDILNGGIGQDDLRGGAGDDIMRGGAGDDIYYVTEAGDQVVENLNEGIDTVHWFAAADYVIPANVEIVRVQSDGAVDVTGNDLDNTIYGRAGANELDGGLGRDTIYGGAGNDTLRGGDGDDVLNGDTGNDILFGGGDNDTLHGGAGNDVLDGGGGSDIMYGGAGNDIYYITAGDNVVENIGEGTDTVIAGVSWGLGDNLENLTLTGTGNLGGSGNALANVIQGNDGDNALHGGQGADTLLGGAGNDTLHGGVGSDKLTGGSGADHFILAHDTLGWSHIGVWPERDTITDFSLAEGDRIDLSSFRTLWAGMESFFVNHFTGQGPGEATLTAIAGGHTLLRIDIDGDRRADGEIMIQNITLTAADDAWIL